MAVAFLHLNTFGFVVAPAQPDDHPTLGQDVVSSAAIQGIAMCITRIASPYVQ